MTAVLLGLLPHLKVLHILFLAVWIAGLTALPVLLAEQDRAMRGPFLGRLRRVTHRGFIWCVTPAAVLTVASGTSLIFLRAVFSPWMFAKLVCVAALVGLHVWIGHAIAAPSTGPQSAARWVPGLPLLLLCLVVAAVLALVLGKPDLDRLPFPIWLRQPLGFSLPFDSPNP